MIPGALPASLRLDVSAKTGKCEYEVHFYFTLSMKAQSSMPIRHEGEVSMAPKPTYEDYENGPYSEFSNVESQRNEILQEEFPEGPYGAATDAKRLGKSSEWEPGQHSTTTRFTYETRAMHEDLPRQYPGAHPTHSEETEES